MRNRVSEKWNEIGWYGIILGAVAGVVVSTFLGPYLTYAGVHGLNSVNAPLYETPQVEITVTNESNFYENGQEVPEFNEIVWKEEYEVYKISVNNKGKQMIRDLQLYMPLPGCGIYTEKEGPGVGGKYDSENIFTMRLVPSARGGIDLFHCGKKFSADNVGPNEGFSTRIVVKQKFDTCDVLVGFNPTARPRIKYSWYENGIRLEENTTVPVEQLNEEYHQAKKLHVSNAIQGPGDRVEGTYFSTVILGVDAENMNKGIKTCQYANQN